MINSTWEATSDPHLKQNISLVELYPLTTHIATILNLTVGLEPDLLSKHHLSLMNISTPSPSPPCGPVDPSDNIFSPCFSETANTLYGTLFLFAAVFSFVGNLLAIGVWSSYLRNYLTVLYLNLSVCDFIISISGTTSTAAALFGDRLPDKSVGRYPALCSLQGMSFELCTTVSGSIISILCIARWRSFAHPFKKVRKVLVLRLLTFAWIYTALPHIGFTISAVIGLTDTKYKYHVAVASCNLVIHNALPPWLESMLVISFAILPTLLNSIIIPVTCSLVVREIVKQNLQHTYYAISSQSKKKNQWYKRGCRRTGSALTVAVVAIVFVSCQLPLWGWQYIDIIDSLVGTKVKGSLSVPKRWNVDFVLYIVLINMNSTINPYLYYVRGSQYRRLLSQKLKKLAKIASDSVSNVKARFYFTDQRKQQPESLKNSNSSLGPVKCVNVEHGIASKQN